MKKKTSQIPLIALLAVLVASFLLAIPAQAEPTRVGVPPEVIAPPWLESRQQAQLATVDQFDVFHDFTFVDRLEESGITFQHHIVDDAGIHYRATHYDHGDGVAVADVDLDGLYDIYFVNQVGANQLWRNLGHGRFEDITQKAGVALEERISVSPSFADTDNDGDPDLYVTTVRFGNVLFENDGTGKFTDISAQSGLDYVGHSSATIFFDYNRDGLLDAFLTNIGQYTEPKPPIEVVGYSAEQDAGGYKYYVGFKDAFSGHLMPPRTELSRLYKNLGDNRFVDVSAETRLQDGGWTGDASTFDVNEDGWPDLYVMNMQGHDHYYENVGGEYFVDKSREVFPKTPWGAMGIKVFDFDNDGRMDLYITDMHSDMSEDIGPEREKLKSDIKWPERHLRSGGMSIFGNAFYHNKGNGQFEEISDQIGVENYWPWGLSSGDINADGYEDLFVASSMNYPYRYGVNSVFLNNRGKKFLDSEFILGVEPRRNRQTAKPWFELDCSGKDMMHKECRGQKGRIIVMGALGTRSSAIFDLDDDGDLDIVTSEFNAAPMVLISDLAEKMAGLHFLKIKLIGTRSNRDGLGAVVRVHAGSQTYTKFHEGHSGYLGQSLFPLYFGLGEAASADRIEVRWPSGTEQTIAGPIAANTLVEIREE